MTVDAMGPLIHMMTMQGKLREARAMCQKAISRYVDGKDRRRRWPRCSISASGPSTTSRTDLESARYRLLTGIELSRQLGMVFYSLLGLRLLAKLQHVCGECEAAWDTLAEASEGAQHPEVSAAPTDFAGHGPNYSCAKAT